MKRYISVTAQVLIASMTAVLGLSSCAKDVPIGDPIDINIGYVLPQSGASEEDNARIQELFDKWGSYIIYDIDENDIFWTQISGTASSGGRDNKYTEGDPAYVGDMLDYLQEIWWSYFPDKFMRSGGAPYRIYLVEEYYVERDYGGGEIYKYPADFYVGTSSIVIGNMSSVATMDEATKKSKKTALINALWSYYVSNGILTTPSEFYTVSDYTTEPEMTRDGYSYIYTDEQLTALRERGFIPNYSAYGYSVYSEIYMKYSETSSSWSYSDPRANDFNYYVAQIFNATAEQEAEFLQYDLVAKKWNIILDYYKENYGIDLRSIALN